MEGGGGSYLAAGAGASCMLMASLLSAGLAGRSDRAGACDCCEGAAALSLALEEGPRVRG
jgi:hypothetical protein